MARAIPKLPVQDRRATKQTTAEAEDQGLFKRSLVQVPVDLSAVMYRNNRNDMIFTGYSATGLSFEVVFAGRRAVMAAPLVTHIASVCDAASKAAKKKGTVFQIDDVRIALVLDGAWRTRVWQDRSGWQSKKHQLVVSQWRLGTGGKVFGQAPVVPDS